MLDDYVIRPSIYDIRDDYGLDEPWYDVPYYDD